MVKCRVVSHPVTPLPSKLKIAPRTALYTFVYLLYPCNGKMVVLFLQALFTCSSAFDMIFPNFLTPYEEMIRAFGSGNEWGGIPTALLKQHFLPLDAVRRFSRGSKSPLKPFSWCVCHCAL